MNSAPRAEKPHARFVVAVTGGVASGKSTVTNHFRELGVPIHDADVVARDLVTPGQPALDEIIATFGLQILKLDGTLDRQKLRDLIFANPAQRLKLQSILHPRIRETLLAAAQIARGPYSMLAIPLLLETRRDYDWVDRVLVVDVPESIQVQRLLKRDGMSEKLVRQILAAQTSREARLGIANDVIENTGTLIELEDAVDRLHQHYLALADEKCVVK